ncbi:MAG: WXG100 family type VII secretion target [Bifidobacteriaceae bacterium]|jgi:WXG100 family type VII secretion target|nr:WXG100 family type VII secretion target [Bifidobacteriaceae bacterium]
MNINVSYEQLQLAAANISQGRDSIYNELDILKNRIEELVSSGFVTDQASGVFHEAFNRFSTGARSTIQGLDEVIRFLRAAEQTLKDTDAQLAASLK